MGETSQLDAALDPSRICLFLDVDGTLLEVAGSPDKVRVPRPLVADLGRLLLRLDGGVALVSGRPISELDQLFRPLALPAAGVHGVEHRFGGGETRRRPYSEVAFRRAAREIRTLIAGCEHLVLECKPGALALHYRQLPAVEDDLRLFLLRLAHQYRSHLALIDGHRVFELVPKGCSKSVAIDAFMAREPFRQRKPVYFGDDTTDLAAFAAVRRHDGIDVAVGDRVSARWHMEGPVEVRRWLSRLAAAIAPGPPAP
jgi:trehalose 6-phosphate phosphatase